MDRYGLFSPHRNDDATTRMQGYFLLGLISLDALRAHATFVMHAFDLKTRVVRS